jgi:tetrahydromethanopterin S-methyltransferase subunit B
MNLIKVENEPSLVRDPNSNAILSIDTAKLNQSRQHRFALENKENQLKEMQEKINKLEELINSLINKNEHS